MPSALLSRVKRLEQSPQAVKAAEYRRKLMQWEDMVSYYMPDLKRQIAVWEYEQSPDSREVMADDFMEIEIEVVNRLSRRHPINLGEYWEWEVVKPIRHEVYKELMLRWYGIRRTDEEEEEALRLGKQLNEDFDNGVPREQSEAVTLFRQWYEQNPRRGYRYNVLHVFKPEGWEWQL
jgi:hypothetical protein